MYKKSENIDSVLEDTAKIKEALVSQSELIKKIKELTVKYPVNKKGEAQKYERKFLILVSDKKMQDKIVKGLKINIYNLIYE
ncbi:MULTISPECIES: hypothetical protein [Clostridium]|uniref:hypothetical protein n=1 Tax=Clostridium TaxID=1485 RepID=UPI00069CC31F|nr:MULTISPECIES: hypothetical protein [Clostridium]KOF58176.1 hypothetical protein AGR56_00730 [Clostridium sp. DMHC 10]MCD2348649.1 hypothetical protein [Clostridium guangxiense]